MKQDGFQCGYCTPGQICSAVGMLAETRRACPARRRARRRRKLTDAEIRERMSGNICRCSAYPHILAAIMRRAREARHEAVHLRTGRQTWRRRAGGGAARRAFIAGGTNLLDLMKLEIERPAHLVDVSRLPMRGIEETPMAACASAPWSQHRAGGPRGCGSAIRCWRRRSWPAARASCATRPRPAATCCSARGAPTSTTPPCPATNASRAPAARRWRA